MLKPLIWGTLTNIEKVGNPEALTGPIARGDAETVEHHLAAMNEKVPNFVPLYKVLGRYTLGIAKVKGTIDREQAKKRTKSWWNQNQSHLCRHG